ncbi:MAG TPA: primosomal protein N', partial [Aeromonadales bacterium]|nr:primosomal protein N' [Aeromonadales bacterium]
MKHRIQVALPVYLDGVFDYFVEGNLPEIGVRVEVKFQSRSLIGVVWSHKSNADVSENKIKSVLDVLDEEPVLSKSNQLFCENISSYYEHSLGEVVQLALPV